ncbi:hypothetical protein DRW48_13385 [Paracoccus suum]|uniref:EthD domain-containing protein n=1 Tax=Paracoccus suum TaxID=2259340 RepID=A0A344PMD5_9RHOB|nr:DUF4286 family protein [Paracoccus suum]AXC50540.1 hypothetical protein DRW48_13385 [Paracoccus suum]
MAGAVLFSEMTPSPDWEGEFNEWYDNEHIPLRMTVPGFTGAQRYKRNDRDYLAVYDMTGTDVLQTPAYVEIKDNPTAMTARMLGSVGGFTRYIGTEIGFQSNVALDDAIPAPVLYSVLFSVPGDRLGDFDAWYDQDHLPALLENPDWLACRRFSLEVAHPQPFNRLALHYLATDEALDSPAREKARATPGRARLAAEPWFQADYKVFYLHGERFSAR